MGNSSMYLFGTESESMPPPNSGRDSASPNRLGFLGNPVPSGTSPGRLPFILTRICCAGGCCAAMAGNPEKCREHAEICRKLAEVAERPEEKARYEDLAVRWAELAVLLETIKALSKEAGPLKKIGTKIDIQ